MDLKKDQTKFIQFLLEIQKKESKDNLGNFFISNHKFRSILGIEQIPYTNLKDELVSLGLVKKGMGKGGRIQLTPLGIKYCSNEIINEKPNIDDLKSFFYEYGEISTKTLKENFGLKTDIDALDTIFEIQQSIHEATEVNVDTNKNLRTLRFKEVLNGSNGSAGNLNFCWNGEEERIAAHRLVEIFKGERHRLEEISGDYGRLVRTLLRNETGKDAKGKMIDLAAALLTKFGTDLLSIREIREQIGIILKIKPDLRVESWHPGSISARRFTNLIGFPEVFSGEPAQKENASLYFPKKTNFPELRPFQSTAMKEMLDYLKLPKGRGIIRMPTGTGKTRTAMMLIHNWFNFQIESKFKKCVCIWTAHTEELCEQAIDQIEEIFNSGINTHYSLDVYRMWGRYVGENYDISGNDTYDRIMDPNSNGCFFIVTNNLILNKIFARENNVTWVRNMVKGSKNLIVIDEAHRACAPTYEEALESFAELDPNLSILGLTATPRNKTGTPNEIEATNALLNIFNNKVIDPFEKYTSPKKFLVDNKILAKPIFELIETNYTVNLGSEISSIKEDLDNLDPLQARKIENELSEKVSKLKRRQPILEKIKEISQPNNIRIMYFGPTVEDAHIVAWRLRSWGISAASVDAKTKIGSRRRIIQDFKEGKIKVLCNCELLTTGFDVPTITHLVIARPTISTVLYEQMLGRGLRGPEFGGTESCVIYNVKDELRPHINSKLAFEKICDDWTLSLSRISPNEDPSILKNSNTTKPQLNVVVNKPDITNNPEKTNLESKKGVFELITSLVYKTDSTSEENVIAEVKSYQSKHDFRKALEIMDNSFKIANSSNVALYHWAIAAIKMNQMQKTNDILERLKARNAEPYVKQLEILIKDLNRAA